MNELRVGLTGVLLFSLGQYELIFYQVSNETFGHNSNNTRLYAIEKLVLKNLQNNKNCTKNLMSK